MSPEGILRDVNLGLGFRVASLGFRVVSLGFTV